MLNVVLQVLTEKQSIMICIGSCVMYRDTYRIIYVVYQPTPTYDTTPFVKQLLQIKTYRHTGTQSLSPGVCVLYQVAKIVTD